MKNTIVLEPIQIPKGKKVYFASDFHLGVPLKNKLETEIKVVKWLDSIKEDAAILFLLGDLFDFWYEYKKVVPKGFVRFLGKLAELSDSGVKIILFHGNHDMWMSDYLEKELNATIYSNPVSVVIDNKHFHMGHGDGLGPKERGYKILRWFFRNKTCIWLFRHIPPLIGMSIAHTWSKSSRFSNQEKEDGFKGEENEYILQYCLETESVQHHDYYIFGHRHLILDLPVGENSRYLNLGEWVNNSHYISFNGKLEHHDF